MLEDKTISKVIALLEQRVKEFNDRNDITDKLVDSQFKKASHEQKAIALGVEIVRLIEQEQ